MSLPTTDMGPPKTMTVQTMNPTPSVDPNQNPNAPFSNGPSVYLYGFLATLVLIFLVSIGVAWKYVFSLFYFQRMLTNALFLSLSSYLTFHRLFATILFSILLSLLFPSPPSVNVLFPEPGTNRHPPASTIALLSQCTCPPCSLFVPTPRSSHRPFR